uniref:RING-type E3 ubiquitin transferase n=1 Tax=Vitis vinifera TaxID=29760 RepID=F6GYK8_VITVI
MWNPKGHIEKQGGRGIVAVAIDRDKGSQHALRWATERLLTKGQTVVLIHVLKISPTSIEHHPVSSHKEKMNVKDLFVTFHCFCRRKDIHCLDILLEDTDIPRALIEFTNHAAVDNLILGASSKYSFIRRFKISDVPGSVSKGAADFCTVYVISKGKISSVRNASRTAPHVSPLHSHIQNKVNNNAIANPVEAPSSHSISIRAEKISSKPHSIQDDRESFKSPFLRGGRASNAKLGSEPLELDTDISFISSERPSSDRMSNVVYEYMDSGPTPRISSSSDHSFGSIRIGPAFGDPNSLNFSSISQESGRTSCSSTSMINEEVEAEMRRLKLELKQTMDMYSTACKEALSAKQKAVELQRWRMEEERRLEEARLAEEAAMAIVEKEKAKCRAAIDAAEASQRLAELESQRRVNAEMKALKEAEDMKKVINNLAQNDIRYRKYTIEEIEEATEFFSESRKIGEGGYGRVYKCYLDHTPVAVKVLRPDASQGRSQFQKEVEILSCIRHPNMVLLLGACPEYGCLVYECMAKGSLDDRLFQLGNTPPLSWQLRFRISAEIATGLLFLHQTKPEPLVHRDLKPGNILLDYNYVSKISDVGLARLVPRSVAENEMRCHMTSTAGTFCYIDPEYQHTGVLDVKSDVYSFGIMLLQVITAKPPMGLTHQVEQAIENGTFKEILDPAVPDWPVEEALSFAKMALQCAELRRKDRPDLGKVILPELNRLRELAEENMNQTMWDRMADPSGPSPIHSQVSMAQDVISNPHLEHSGYSSKSHSSTPSMTGRQ